MDKAISVDTAREGVYLPRRQVQKMRRVRNMLDEARRRASDLVAQADVQADAIHRQAYSEGYEAGLTAAAGTLMDYFGAAQILGGRLHDQLTQRSKVLLAGALDRPESLLAALDEGLQALAGPVELTLHIHLPATASGMRLRVEAALQKAGRSAVHVSYHDDARLLMVCGDHVFEFDPPTLLTQAQHALLAQFHDLPQQCRKLSADAARTWEAEFAKRHIQTA